MPVNYNHETHNECSPGAAAAVQHNEQNLRTPQAREPLSHLGVTGRFNRKKLYTIATSVWDWVFSIQVIISVSSEVKIKVQGDLQGSKVKVKKGSFQYKTKR